MPESEEPIPCRKCGKWTRKIITESTRIDWSSTFFVGLGAILFPSLRRKELRCEHCGKNFLPKSPPMKMGDKVSGIALAGFCLIILLIVLFLLAGSFD